MDSLPSRTRIVARAARHAPTTDSGQSASTLESVSTAPPPHVSEGPPGSGAVAGGSTGTAQAAAAILRAGGNATDAAIGGMLASAVAEMSLTSPGGGGFLLVRDPDGSATMYDFFTDTPGLGAEIRRPAPLIPMTVRYPGAEQVFQVGIASVAVPGVIEGLLHAHRERGRLPMAQIVAPGIALATDGSLIEESQAQILDLIRDIFDLTPQGRAITQHPDGRPKHTGDSIVMPQYAAMLARIASGEITGITSPLIADPLIDLMERHSGLVTAQDLQRYRVFDRRPLTLHRNGSDILTNPPPSFGGGILVDSMANTDIIDGSAAAWYEAISMLSHVTERNREADLKRGIPHASKGTTHISVVDGQGQVATMTTSNGSGSGIVWPGTQVYLNNMLGEEDLNPAGFHSLPPGLRLGSMMSPTVVRRADGTVMALGTGGSERIRSALLAVLLRTVDLGEDLVAAVSGPRFHPKPDGVQLEPGWPQELADRLAALADVTLWPDQNVFFGGVHAVLRRPDGSVQAVGDARRGGRTAVVPPL